MRRLTALIMILLILACTIPMGLNPNWNGERKTHIDQYELMGDSLLHGRLDLDIDVDPKLLTMENPYSPEEREALGVEYAWDHAFYNGHYYMYFGVMPALLIFAPFQAIFGRSLTTYHATQIFVTIIIIGIFTFFAYLRKKYFTKMKWSVYILLSVAVSLMSVWYSIAAPSLYCTAITAALACEIWSIFLLFRAANEHEEGKKPFWWLLGGSLLGAIAFGCRPTIALANLLIVPVYYHILKKQTEKNYRFVLKLIGTLLPYLIIGLFLMWYNYARFGSIFEFGQTYQLTVVDQTVYTAGSINLPNIFNGFFEMFIRYDGFSSRLPFLQFSGVLFEFPLILLAIYCVVKRKNLELASDFKSLIYTLLIAIAAITVAVVAWSPYVLERYHMDINMFIGIICFIIISSSKKLPNWAIYLFAILTIIMCAWLFLVPCDHNIGEFLFR